MSFCPVGEGEFLRWDCISADASSPETRCLENLFYADQRPTEIPPAVSKNLGAHVTQFLPMENGFLLAGKGGVVSFYEPASDLIKVKARLGEPVWGLVSFGLNEIRVLSKTRVVHLSSDPSRCTALSVSSWADVKRMEAEEGSKLDLLSFHPVDPFQYLIGDVGRFWVDFPFNEGNGGCRASYDMSDFGKNSLVHFFRPTLFSSRTLFAAGETVGVLDFPLDRESLSFPVSATKVFSSSKRAGSITVLELSSFHNSSFFIGTAADERAVWDCEYQHESVCFANQKEERICFPSAAAFVTTDLIAAGEGDNRSVALLDSRVGDCVRRYTFFALPIQSIAARPSGLTVLTGKDECSSQLYFLDLRV